MKPWNHFKIRKKNPTCKNAISYELWLLHIFQCIEVTSKYCKVLSMLSRSFDNTICSQTVFLLSCSSLAFWHILAIANLGNCTLQESQLFFAVRLVLWEFSFRRNPAAAWQRDKTWEKKGCCHVGLRGISTRVGGLIDDRILHPNVNATQRT